MISSILPKNERKHCSYFLKYKWQDLYNMALRKIKLSQVEFPFENFEHIVNLLEINNLYLLILHTHKNELLLFHCRQLRKGFCIRITKIGLN